MQIHFDDDDRDDYYFKEGGDDAKENEMRNKYGDDVDNFSVPEGGINRNRTCCTDVYCIVLFWGFIGGMIYAAMYGYQNGQLTKLTAPIDAGLNFCGIDEYKDYPKMILTDFMVTNGLDILQSGVCIKTCPEEAGKALTDGKDCKNNAKKNCADHKTYKTIDVLDFCIPTSKEALGPQEQAGYKALKEQLKNSAAGSVFQDMYKSSTSMYISMFLALVWSVVYIYLLSAFAECLAWCCVILIWLGLCAATGFGFYMWNESKIKFDTVAKENNYDQMDEANKEAFDKQYGGEVTQLFMFSLLTAICFCCFTCLVLCKKKDLQQAIDVIDASADYIAHNKRVILVPNFHFLLTLIFSMFWIYAFLCVASLNKITALESIPQGRDLEWEDKKVKYAGLYMFFGYLWITAWIEYTSRFIVIVGAATYYFNNDRDNKDVENPAEIMYGFKCAYITHQGSIAVGAFIIALIRFIKYIFYYAAKYAEKSTGENAVSKCLVKCAICILNCIEKICDYLNESAFCYMAVTGDSFFSSAWSGFLLNLKHGVKFFFAISIAKLFILLGKLGIVVANLVTLYFLMELRGDLKEVGSVYGPMIVVGVVSFLASSMFLSLFDESVRALLTCLCVDIDANQGYPKFGPATFHDNYEKKIVNKTHEMN